MDYVEFLKARINKGNDFAATTGVRINHVGDGCAEGQLAITPTTLNPVGVVHGGALTTLADTIAGAAAYSNSRDRAILTVNCTMNFLRAGTGGKLICNAKAQRAGRTIQVIDAVITDEQDRLVATGTYTFISVDSLKPPTPPEDEGELEG